MNDLAPTDLVSLTTTVATLAQARAFAGQLLAQRLGACVQLDETMRSLYSWEGQLREEAEVRLTIKTLAACLPALQRLFAARHPYRLPQFVTVRVDASADYAAWIRAEVDAAPSP